MMLSSLPRAFLKIDHMIQIFQNEKRSVRRIYFGYIFTTIHYY